MLESNLFRRDSWKLLVAALVCLVIAFCLYPSTSAERWRDVEWKRSLTGSTWTFARQDGMVISDKLTLGLLGKVEGYVHPNEARWKVREGSLLLLSADGRITSRFALGATPVAAPLRLQQLDGGVHQLTLTKSTFGKLRSLSAFSALLGLACLLGTLQGSGAWLRKARGIIRGRWLAAAVLGIWFLLAGTLASTSSHVPDEAWFLQEALVSGKQALEGDWVTQLLFHKNAFGYGSVWWSLYTGMVLAWHGLVDVYGALGADNMFTEVAGVARVMMWEVTPQIMATPMFMMRLLVLASLAAFGLVLLRHARSGNAALLSTLVLVTMPLAWWSGKLASPELMGSALFALAVTMWFVAGRAVSALVLASAAVAIKLTIAPVYIVLLAFIAWELWHRPGMQPKRLLAYALLCFSVILCCNTWLLHDPRAGIEQLVTLSKTYHPLDNAAEQSAMILYGEIIGWEGITFGSLAYWAGGFPLIIVALLTAFSVQRRLGAFLLAGGLLQYAFMMSQPPHAWYWFPVILSLLIPFSQLRSKAATFVGIILLVCLFPFDMTTKEISSKVAHLHELNNVALERSCLVEQLHAWHPREVYDMAALGTMVSRVPNAPWKASNYHDSYVALVINRLPPSSDRRVLLLGERSLENYPSLRTLSEAPGSLIGQCGSIRIIKLGN